MLKGNANYGKRDQQILNSKIWHMNADPCQEHSEHGFDLAATF